MKIYLETAREYGQVRQVILQDNPSMPHIVTVSIPSENCALDISVYELFRAVLAMHPVSGMAGQIEAKVDNYLDATSSKRSLKGIFYY